MIAPRSVERRDRPAVLNLLQGAFEGPLEAMLVERLWASNAIVSERIVDDGGVIAYAAISEVSIGIIGDRNAFGEALGLAPAATASRRRREGHGAAAVRAAINAGFNAFPNRLIFVLGDTAYYRRFGFIPAAPLGYVWEGGEVGDAFQVLRNGGTTAPFAGVASDAGSISPATVFYNDAFSVFGEES